MVALLNQDLDVEYKNSDEFEQAETGGSRQEERVLQEEKEREEIINQIRSREQFETSHHIDFSTGEVTQEDVEGFEDELSVASIIDLIEKGIVSDEELESFLDKALTSVSATTAKDKVKAKKQLAQILELLQILEVNLSISCKNSELQNNLRSLQERLVVINKNFNIEVLQSLLRTSDLQVTLQKASREAIRQPENIRIAREVLKQIAKDTQQISKQAEQNNNLTQNLNLQTKQQAQNLLKESFQNIQKSFENIKAQLPKETNPARQEQIKTVLKELSKQAEQLKQAYTRLQSSNAQEFAVQLQQAQQVVESISVQTQNLQIQVQNNPALNTQISDLAISQQSSVQLVQRLQTEYQTVQRSNVIPFEKAVENYRTNLQAEQKTNPKPETQKKLEVLDKVKESAKDKQAQEDKSKEKEKTEDKAKKETKEKPKEKDAREKESKEKAEKEPEKKSKSKIQDEPDNVIKPDPEVFKDKPSTKPDTCKEACKCGCGGEHENGQIPPGQLVNGQPKTNPDKNHVHGDKCGCGPQIVALQTSGKQLDIEIQPDTAVKEADGTGFGVAI